MPATEQSYRLRRHQDRPRSRSCLKDPCQASQPCSKMHTKANRRTSWISWTSRPTGRNRVVAGPQMPGACKSTHAHHRVPRTRIHPPRQASPGTDITRRTSSATVRSDKNRSAIARLWREHVNVAVDHKACRDHLGESPPVSHAVQLHL